VQVSSRKRRPAEWTPCQQVDEPRHFPASANTSGIVRTKSTAPLLKLTARASRSTKYPRIAVLFSREPHARTPGCNACLVAHRTRLLLRGCLIALAARRLSRSQESEIHGPMSVAAIVLAAGASRRLGHPAVAHAEGQSTSRTCSSRFERGRCNASRGRTRRSLM
jgi:hypothetical protein